MPYRSEDDAPTKGLQHIGGLVPQVKKEASRKTERGELMRFFQSRVNASRARDGHMLITMPRMGKILEGIPTKDLYFLQSVCNRAKNFSKKFWWEVDPKKHTPEAKESAPF